MKRFYLIICFLMSIIGSAWGQETVSKTVEITPDNVTTNSYDHSYTAENLSVTLNAQIDNSKADVDGNTPNNFKVNKDTGRHITVTPENGAKITSIVLWGLDKQRPIKVTYKGSSTDYSAGTSTDDVIYATISGEGSNVTWTATFKEGYDSEIKFEYSGSNLHITKIEVTYTYTPITTYDKSFSISDFNFATNRNANSGLNRSLCGFDFVFSGGDALKYNGGGILTFRTRNTNQNGSVAISTTNGAKIFSASFTFDKDMTDYYTAEDGDGNDLASSVSNNVVTVTSAQGVSKIVFAKKNVAGNDKDTDDSYTNGREFTLSEIKLVTDTEMSTEKVTPELTSFKSSAITVDLDGGKVDNPLTTNPPSFAVTYTSSNEAVATVDENTGAVTLHAAGETTITAEYGGGTYYNAAASTSYMLTVIAETVSFEKNEVVFAVNTNKAYTAATGDDGKVTYTALEGNVNAATSSASNAITYTSSDENLIKVNAETGELSLGDNWTAGKTVTITATSAAGQTATYTVKLKFETSISFGDANGDGKIDDVEQVYAHRNVGFVEPQAVVIPSGVNLVSFTSNNQKIAVVNEATGEVTFPGQSNGTVSITATIPYNEYYMGSSAKYEIVVGDNVSAGDAAMTDYNVLSYVDAKYTANTGHMFTVEPATIGKHVVSGEQFTNVPGIELTFGAYTGQGNVNTGDLNALGALWTVGDDKYLQHQAAATFDENTNFPTGGGYIAFEPVVNGILTLDMVWFAKEDFVLVDKLTKTIVESYVSNSGTSGEHRFSTLLHAGRTYYIYNKSEEGEASAMKFRSASFTPVFIDMNSGAVPSTLADGKVVFKIDGANFYNGTSAVPFLSTANHQHDDITYTVDGSDALNMTADGAFEVLEAMESADGTVTVTITANVEAKTPVPNADNDGNNNSMHRSVAYCQVSYTKAPLSFAKQSIDVSLFADNVGADITEPGINYLKDDITYSSDNANAFSVDSNTGNLSVGTNPSGKTTITATVNNEDITRYYTSSSASYVVNCSNYGHVNLVNTEITMIVGDTGYNILKEECFKIFNNDADKLKKCFRLNDNGTFYGDAGERDTYYKLISDELIGKGNDGGVTRFYKDATKTVADKKNGSENTNIVYVSKSFSIDAKTVGTTTVYVNLEKIALSNNGNADDAKVEAQYDAVTIPIKVTVVPRGFTAENATLRVWDFTKEIDAETLQTFAENNSTYWTYNESDNTVKTSVDKPEENEGAGYYEEYNGDKAAFLEGKKAFENQVFDLSVFNENLKQEGSKDVLKLSTYNQSNYDYYTKEELGKQHNHTLNIVSDITLNKKSTIKDNNYMPPVSGSNTNLGENSDECYRGINLEGKASFLHVPNVDYNISIMMIADHNSEKTDDYLGFASSGSNQAGLIVGPSKMTDGTYAAGYNYNRLTTVINYAPRTDGNGIVTEVAVEAAGGQVNVVSVVAGYIATSGILNKGEGKVPTSAATRTDGYTTVVSPYNIDMTGQKVVKAYICDYYGKVNNKVHMKQIKHIPANTPVMLRGYARDLYALFISEGNKAVDPGVDESFIKNNRLRGNATEDIYVPLEETEVNSEGEVVKYYNYGLSGSKWVKFGVDGTMKAGKAYLRLTEEEWADLQEAMISSAGVSATRLSFEFEDLDASDDNVSTGIVQVGTQKDVAGDGYYYSINGMRMGKEKPASKGVYIYNGRKIVIK